jgi:uncharacterized protein YlxW (UPF0749 family)
MSPDPRGERPDPGRPDDDVVPHPFGTSVPGAPEGTEAPKAGADEPETSDPEADEPETSEPQTSEPAAAARPAVGAAPAGEAPPPGPAQPRIRPRRRRDPLAAALIGVLTLLLGFAFAVQVRNADEGQMLAGAREEDLVRILDEVNSREERLREQIAEQRTALEQLNSSDSRSSTALDEARRRAEAIGILNGTIPAHGAGLVMTIRDPDDEVRVADILDAIQELRGAGAETMQIDGVRVGVSTAVTGDPGSLMIDGRPITAPYDFLVIGSPQDMETAMNIPGGVVPHITSRGGSVAISQSTDVLVDALRPLDTPQYAAPDTGN